MVTVDDTLLRAYYRHIPPEEVRERASADLAAAYGAHAELAAERPQGTARVRVHTPEPGADGWSCQGRTVVETVTDDMPFLVDSLTMALDGAGHTVHVIVHPQMMVTRDVAGTLHSVRPAPEPGQPDLPRDDEVRESWMHVEIDRLGPDDDPTDLESAILAVFRDVREAVEDWGKMHARIGEVVAVLRDDPAGAPADDAARAVELLDWLADDHFTFLGCRDLVLADGELRAVPGTGLGILRPDPAADEVEPDDGGPRPLLRVAKADERSTVHRAAYLDVVAVTTYDADGAVTGERRFVGLFSSAAYTESLTRVPLLREKAAQVLQRLGFDKSSHAGKALMDVLENYPRDELFGAGVDELTPLAEQLMWARERRALRVFARREGRGRYLSVLVYLPRDRYTTAVRERFRAILRERLGAATVEFSVRIDESAMARVHLVVRPASGESLPEVDAEALEHALNEASRSWRDDLQHALVRAHGEREGRRLARRWSEAFPEAYKEDFSAVVGAEDVARLQALTEEGSSGFDLALSRPAGMPEDDEEADALPRGDIRLKVYRADASLSLSHVLPMLTSLGVEVVDERPYQLTVEGRDLFCYEFGLRHPGREPEHAARLFEDALRAIWDGYNEPDGFNGLVLGAGLTWRQAAVLRAYAKYMRQGLTPFALDTITSALVGNHDLARELVRLFETRFDPDLDLDDDARAARYAEVKARIERGLDDVASLDHDRIVRSYAAHVDGTLRTSFFQVDDDGRPRAYMAFKLDPGSLPDLPAPRPAYEIFVYSPRVEGVHLRFGPVARGGLRWSDRRDDFRTEVLGLVKAQMVKNTVIVPVGAKGGFYAKNLPDPGGRQAWMDEGVACYRTFISALLDVTDNLVDGATVPPERVVRHDGDDHYLVVAADKGTATFSDIANSIALERGFWLGDAFASGGSVGYDHKAMGITARGAWVSVQRHFREMGVDCQTEDVTVVGIGDMSGDVFGNGMLCSEHIRLVAAFDHRHVFLDPDPDAATSYAERKRMFALPRSSWADYDTSLISEGGGVFPRTAKSVPVSPQVAARLGLDEGVERLTPAELMRAILLAPADLLWNGGIGTYVKSSDETDADAGDKANDAIRVDGRDLRVRCVGEGGNLGLTQLGRIEYARHGGPEDGHGRIDTDFIDNSAGVGTSDLEVNIKILLDLVMAEGSLSREERPALLASMTDEVGELVLRDNYEQNLALANAEANSPNLLHVQEDWMRKLERDGLIDRELEGLPSSREVRRRLGRGQGLTTPESAVLMAWTKIVLARELAQTDLPDDPFLRIDLYTYFPAALRQDYRPQMEAHQLRRDIVVTRVVNDLVNGAGMTYWPRLSGETGASAAEVVMANFVAREIYGSLALREELVSYDNRLDAGVQTRMRLEMRTLVERASRWLLNNRRAPMDAEQVVESFGVTAQRLLPMLPELMTGRELDAYESRRDTLVRDGVPEDLAARVAALPPAYMLLGVVETAGRDDVDPVEVTRLHFVLGERLGLSLLTQRILALPRDDRWQTMARATLRDDLHTVHHQLTAQVLAATSGDDPAPLRVAAWEETEAELVARAVESLADICDTEDPDLARLSVGLRVVRGLLG
ncbi:NAD-glutamate dehydrogenase [uncultured Nocardioides sp.]|uniref:NAD-glutamate dehydrogenase n=1 Tax=uncultured Nocardioides sp. TaxID=198441 RepID=UPI002623BD52|nr:NAD-glutamate dehydrogenase [uncultured Nocardioides sp.]